MATLSCRERSSLAQGCDALVALLSAKEVTGQSEHHRQGRDPSQVLMPVLLFLLYSGSITLSTRTADKP